MWTDYAKGKLGINRFLVKSSLLQNNCIASERAVKRKVFYPKSFFSQRINLNTKVDRYSDSSACKDDATYEIKFVPARQSITRFVNIPVKINFCPENSVPIR